MYVPRNFVLKMCKVKTKWTRERMVDDSDDDDDDDKDMNIENKRAE